MQLFYSYAREDSAWCERLAKQIAGLPPELISEAWYDRKIRPGDNWNGEIGEHLEQADIILILVSSNYFAKDYCGLEAKLAMKRHESGAALVIPVVLSPCEMSGAEFAKVEAINDPNKPLSSLSKKKQELELRRIAGAIGDRARERLGAGPKLRLPHPNRDQLKKLLYQLCNRTLQKQELADALDPAQRKDGRPFLIFTRGVRDDAIDRFTDRLEQVLLPRVFGEKPSRFYLAMPVYQSGRSAEKLFGPPLAEAVDARFGATIAEMADAIRNSTDVVLLTARFHAQDWSAGGKALLESFVAFWSAWPLTSAGKHLIVNVSITYGEAGVNREIDALLESLKGQLAALAGAPPATTGIGGVVLSALPPISEVEVKNWVEERPVSALFASPADALGRLTCIYERPELRIPMQPLAEVHLSKWLDVL
jgi:hypothetical protein